MGWNLRWVSGVWVLGVVQKSEDFASLIVGTVNWKSQEIVYRGRLIKEKSGEVSKSRSSMFQTAENCS